MIDYHCHLLPGLDDGPDAVAESLAMARALAAFGFREVCCTPHCIKGHYEVPPVEVREAVRRLQSRLDSEGIALMLHAGMEYYLDSCFEQFAGNLLPLGESRLVLCEAPPQAPPGLVAEMAGLIIIQGYLPLVAHPERSEVVWKMLGPGSDPETEKLAQGAKGPEEAPAAAGSWWHRLFFSHRRQPAISPAAPLPDAPEQVFPEETLFQANLGSFAGYYGPVPQRRAYELLQRSLYSCLASDLHDARSAAFLDVAREKLDVNPALRRLGTFLAPPGQGGNDQLAFW